MDGSGVRRICMALRVICARPEKRRSLPLAGALLIALICAFGPMVHERYSCPAVLLLRLGYVA